MTRHLTTAQFDNVSAQATKPSYLVQLGHAGHTEYLATTEDAVYNGTAYEAGGIEVKDIRDQVSATIELFATQERISECISGTWRGGQRCRIYCIPDVPGGEPEYEVTAAVLVFDGTIDTSSYRSPRIRVTVIPKDTSNLFTPRHSFSDVSAIMPVPGVFFGVSGSTYPLKAR